MDTNKLLQEKVIVISGGAKVVVGSRSSEDGNDIFEAIKVNYPDAAILVKGDITQTESCKELIDAEDAKFCRLDGLFNLAGILPFCNLPEMEE